MKKLLQIIMIISLMSCSTKSFDNEKDLLDYLNNPDYGYLQQKNVNGYDFSLLYKPTDLLVQQELSNNVDIEKIKIQKLRDQYGKYLYFSISISKEGKELLSTTPKNRNEFGSMVNRLAFGMRDKVHLYNQHKDTLNLLDYNYPRMYGMGKATTMLFVYPKDQKYLQDEYLNFTIEDLGTYTGEIKFKIETEKIKKQPQLSF